MYLNRYVGVETFIGRYLHMMVDQETPQEYDWWCALWLLSIACGRELIVDRPLAPVFMNLYVILVANSGITRKSSAVRQASSIASELNSDDQSIMGMVEGKTTPENLDVILHRRSEAFGTGQLAITVSELAIFLGTERYTQAMPPLLTDLYDCPTSRKGGGTISRGGLEQSKLFISLLSASTPAWLVRSVNPNVVEGGFTSRCMFILSDEPKRKIAWPSPTSRSDDQRTNLLDQLRCIRSDARRYKTLSLNPAALSQFRKWYAKRKLSVDAFRSSFESREDAHILRLAGFLCINDESWVIQSAHIKLAIRVIESVKQNSARLFEGAGTRNKFILGIEAIRDSLLAAGIDPIPRSKLYLRCRQHIDNGEYRAILDVLHEVGAIQRFEMKDGERGRPTDLIRGTKLLAAKGFTEIVLEKF